MSHSETSAPVSECGCHIRIRYHERPVSPTTSVESLVDGTAGESDSSLTLTSTLSSIDRAPTRSHEDFATASREFPDRSGRTTSPHSGTMQTVVKSFPELGSCRASEHSKAITVDADVPPRAYTLRVPKNMGQRTLFIEKPSPTRRSEHEGAFSRLDRTYKRVESIVSSFSQGLCVILHQPMIRPRKTQCGHYFCRDCIIKRQKRDKTCPCCGELVVLNTLEEVGPMELRPTLQGWKIIEQQPREEQSRQQS